MMALLAVGCRVSVVGRSPERMQAVLARAEAAGYTGMAQPYVADLADEDALRGAAAAMLAAHDNRIDVFVHAAGVMEEAPWEALTTEQMHRLFQVNSLAPMILCQAFADALAAAEGQVVFINSSSVQTVRATKTPYTVAKTALKALADSFRAEFNPKGVRTLSVYPGRTGTDMQRRLHQGRGEAFHPELFIQPSDVASTVLHLLQLPRTVEVTEVFMRPMRNWMKPGAGL